MKVNKLSIKWKIFAYLVAFVGILLVLLWLFQTVFLDSFYKSIKTRSIKSFAEEITDKINKDDLVTTLNKISSENYISIRIIGENGENIYMSDPMPDSLIHKISTDDIYKFYSVTLENGGVNLQMFPRDIKTKFLNGSESIKPPPERGIQSMIYTKIISKKDGTYPMIMLNSTISPVNTTVETIQVQLIFISIVLIVLAVILALFISRKISKPIIKINQSAKELAGGNYNTVFEGEGYLEIEELNDTLNYAAKELSKVERLRRELISNISHDLRTPLTMITGYGEVIRDIPNENTPENIQIIIDEAKHLSNLVTDILDISKLQSGSNDINISRLNITRSIKNILERYSTLIKAEGYTIDFNFEEEVFVNADEIKISQVIYNLINNAITYTGEDKKITVNQIADKSSVKIEIIDTGEGIEEEDIPYIWDRYYKTNKTHKRASVGTGLGLSIVKTVLDAHNSEYGVISSKGNGSNFWFKLKRD